MNCKLKCRIKYKVLLIHRVNEIVVQNLNKCYNIYKGVIMIYRIEHPKPQMRRDNWLNLNGKWHFEIASDGKEDEYYFNDGAYRNVINVPFCPESVLSGINNKKFMRSVWYRKKVILNAEQINGRVLLHFGAVDYEAHVFVNGKLVCKHIGGYSSFCADITDCISEGDNVIILNAIDDTRSNAIPSGKQSAKADSYGCHYTRTTGIWQTVWLEFVPKKYLLQLKFDTDITNGDFLIDGIMNTHGEYAINYDIVYRGNQISCGSIRISENKFTIKDKINNPKLWEIGKGELYDVKIAVTDYTTGIVDIINSYFGYRKIEIQGKKLLLNDKSVILRQVLDQGYYPDGVYTAPNEKALYRDIDLALQYGYNGARLHQKIFEERYLYYADIKGFLVWEEYPNWGCKLTADNAAAVDNAIAEWKEIIARDYNHPCIIGWCPLNEAWFVGGNATDYDTQKKFYNATKSLDSLRPVIGSSGGDMFVTDIHDVHFYSHNAATLKRQILSGNSNAIPSIISKAFYLNKAKPMKKYKLKKLPLYVSEYGGLSYMTEGKTWGYFAKIKNEIEYVEKYIALTNAIFNTESIGFCYTQLYDVEQEQNGLLKYDRSHKLSDDAIKQIRNCNLQNPK